MIAYCPSLEDSPAAMTWQAQGASEAASQLATHLGEVLENYSGPRLQLLIPEILALVRGSEVESSDSEQAPVTPATATQALRLAVLLPKSQQIPEISADPDGEISFDWVGNSGMMFSVSIDATGRLAYAGRFGERSKIHGIEQLSSSCPHEILRGIERVAS